MARLLGGLFGESQQQEVAQDVATLPMRLGGLGLRSASRTAPGAFWASWADALPMIQARLPVMANAVSKVASESCRSPPEFWMRAGSLAVQVGPVCGQVLALLLLQSQSRASGSMAGNTTRLLLLNTICPVLCCRSTITCRSRRQCGHMWSSNWSGIHVVTTSLPHNDLGTITAPIGHCRSSLRVWWFRRQFGKAPCSMSTVGSFAFSCSGAGENFSAHLPGSRRCGSVQRQALRDECDHHGQR